MNRGVKYLFYVCIFLLFNSCSSEPRLTGYKYGGGTDNGKIRTCEKEDFVNKWWSFETNNSIVSTLVPGFEDLCVLTGESGIVFWNEVEGWGVYQDYWDWYCSDLDTMKIIDSDTDSVYWVTIYGIDPSGCYDMHMSYSGMGINGSVCPCTGPPGN